MPVIKKLADRTGATSINPATGAVIQSYPHATADEVEHCLDQAHHGFTAWRDTTIPERVTVLQTMATVLRVGKRDYAETITREMGKPITDAVAEIEKCAGLCEWYAEHGPAFLADEPVTIENAHAYVSYAPLGTVLGVMPWNFPFWQVMRAAVPILLGGNGFVLKHASNVLGCAYALEAAWRKSGLPVGVLQVLNVPSQQIETIIADKRIAAVTLTGSVGAGSAVAAAAGKALKKSVLELGGSDPFIVLADADIDGAVSAGIKARFGNAGQVCIAAKRFILEKPIADEFTQKFIAAAKALIVGDPIDPKTQMGPLARADLRDELDTQVQKTLSQGAKLLLGGNAIPGPGAFYEPTILGEVTSTMVAFSEETFGPVAALTVADDAEDALALANQSDYGLSGNLWTRDLDRAQALAARMETGAVFINGFSASDTRVPIGGVKNSGYGRELSHFGIHAFMNAKTVWIKK